jgi:hypothetical protein
MNAKQYLSEFALDVVLKRISQATTDRTSGERVDISVACNVDDLVEIDKYVKVLEFLKRSDIISKLKNKTGGGYIEDDDHNSWEMTFYTPSFIINHKKLRKFLIESSRLPKYALSMDTRRRLILNDKYIVSTPHFDSVNYHFICHALVNPDQIITKEALTKTAGKFDKRFHTILEQINISPELRKVFFPGVSLDAAKFRNNVTVKDLKNSGVNEKKLNKFLKKLQKI